MWPRLRAKHALLIKLWKTACSPASRHPLPSLPPVWAWESLGKVAMVAEGAPDQLLATLPTAASSVRILLRKMRRKNYSTLVVDLTMKVEKVMRPPQTRSTMRRVRPSCRSLPTRLVLPFSVTLLPARSQFTSFHAYRHPLPRPRLTFHHYRGLA